MRTSLLLIVLVEALTCSAETINWTNTSNGNWNVAANWSPNRVPSTNDIAVLTNAGAYTVTLNISPTIAGLVIGGATGTQTVATAGRTLTLNGVGRVTPDGRLVLSGGALSGTNQINLAGAMTWEYGAIDTNAAMTVSAGGRVALASVGNHAKLLYGSLTNGGAITWQPLGSLNVGGTLHNLAGGLFEAQVNNTSILEASSNAVIVNDGVLRKSAGGGNINCYVHLLNRGIVDTHTGTLTLQDDSVLYPGCSFTGAGVTRLNAGTHTLTGGIHSENLVLDGAALAGDGTLSGTFIWSAGQLNPGASLTVAANGALTFSSGAKQTKFIYGSLTNGGIITWQPLGNLSIGGRLHNLAGARFDAQVDNTSILTSGNGAIFINDGMLRKSAGSFTVDCAVPTINNGTVEIFAGTLQFNGDYTNPAGTILLAGGTFRTTQPLYLLGGQLTGWGTVWADMTNAACIRPEGSDGVLTINGKLTQVLNGSVEFGLAGNTPGMNQTRLNITGTARLRGTIGVRLAEGYLPEPDTGFPVMTFASRSGDFTCFNGFILLGQGRRLTALYGPTSLTLATVAALEPAFVPLRMAVEDSALVCWPTEFVGYQLYGNTNLNLTNWTLIPGATNRYLESSPLPPEKYFRLSTP